MTSTPYEDNTIIGNVNGVKEKTLEAVQAVIPSLIKLQNDGKKTTDQALVDIAEIVAVNHAGYNNELIEAQKAALDAAEIALVDDSNALASKKEIESMTSSTKDEIKRLIRKHAEDVREINDELPKVEATRRELAIRLFGNPNPTIQEKTSKAEMVKEWGPIVAIVLAMSIDDMLFGAPLFKFLSSTQAAYAVIVTWILIVNFAIFRLAKLNKLAATQKEALREHRKNFPDGIDKVMRARAVPVDELPLDYFSQRRQIILLYIGCVLALPAMRIFAYVVGKKDDRALFGTAILVMLALAGLVIKQVMSGPQYPADKLKKYFSICRIQGNMKKRLDELTKVQTNPEVIKLYKRHLMLIEPLNANVEAERQQLLSAKAEIVRISSLDSKSVIDWPAIYVAAARQFLEELPSPRALPANEELVAIYAKFAQPVLPMDASRLMSKLDTAISKLAQPEIDIYAFIAEIHSEVIEDIRAEATTANFQENQAIIDRAKKTSTIRFTAARS